MRKIYTLLLLFAAATVSAFAAVDDSSASAQDDEWTLLGTGKYTDDIMTNSGWPSMTWEVEIYESKSTPGFYRVENPYGNGKCPYFDEPFDCCDFLLHAENPDAVWMEYVEIKNVDFGLMARGYIARHIPATWPVITLPKVTSMRRPPSR